MGPYHYDVPPGFCWVPNDWKLEPIEATPANVSFEQSLLDKVKPIQKKKKKNRMNFDLRARVENQNIFLYIQTFFFFFFFFV